MHAVVRIQVVLIVRNHLKCLGTNSNLELLWVFSHSLERPGLWQIGCSSFHLGLPQSKSLHCRILGERACGELGTHSEREGRECEVVTIDTSELGGTYVFKLSTLVGELNLAIRRESHGTKNGLIFAFIRSQPGPYRRLRVALLSGRVTQYGYILTTDFQTGRAVAYWARNEFIDHSRRREGTHWCGELHGWYDSDEEVEKININDDLMNMLEGDW